MKHFLLSFVFLCSNTAWSQQYHFNLRCMDQVVIKTTLALKNIRFVEEMCSQELISHFATIDMKLTADEARVILAMVVAHHTASYGKEDGEKYDELIENHVLNCFQYSLLVGYLLHTKSIHIIGFHGGVVGNHAQVLYVHDKRSLLLDPTVSIVAETTYDDLLQGKPVKDVILVHPNLENDEYVRGYFTELVTSALEKGAYRPSDILYYYEGWKHALHLGPTDPYITPGGVKWRREVL